MNTEEQNRRLGIVIVLLLVFLALFVVYRTVYTAKHTVKNPAIQQESAIDPTPYQSLYPDFKNLSDLSDIGVTDNQLTGLKYALYTFSKEQGTVHAIGVVSDSVGSVSHTVTDQGVSNTVNFAVKLDSTVYNARLTYTGFNPVALSILDNQGTVIYNSSTIDIDN